MSGHRESAMSFLTVTVINIFVLVFSGRADMRWSMWLAPATSLVVALSSLLDRDLGVKLTSKRLFLLFGCALPSLGRCLSSSIGNLPYNSITPSVIAQVLAAIGIMVITLMKVKMYGPRYLVLLTILTAIMPAPVRPPG